jgi:cytochrome c2
VSKHWWASGRSKWVTRRRPTGDFDCDLAGRRVDRRGEHWWIGSGNRSQDARSGAHAGRPGATGLVGRVSAGQPHSAHRRRRPHHPALELVTGDPIDPLLLEAAGDPLAAYAGDHGADIFRACVACHTLGADQANRACPTLAGIFGRRIATLPGYNFSEALKRLDIVWTPETVSRLFEIGPSAYTPGTKMPEQRIGSEQDRAALVQFLERATKR